MVTAKEYFKFNIRKIQRKAITSKYQYSIFNINNAFKLHRKNLNTYFDGSSNTQVGLLLKNPKMLDKKENTTLFKDRMALVSPSTSHVIIKLVEQEGGKFVKWLYNVAEYVIGLNPSIVMIPIDSSRDVRVLSNCNILIQELNSVLLSYATSCEVVIYQNKEPLSSLAYIIQSVAFPDKVSLCIDIDYLESNMYSLRDIAKDIVKFGITNRISIVKTNTYTLKHAVLKEFLKQLPSDVIVYGENI